MTKPKDAGPAAQAANAGANSHANSHAAAERTKSPETIALLSNKAKEIKKLLDMGVQRGYLTFVEVNELLPPEVITPDAIDEVMGLLAENEIEVIDTTKRPKDSEEEESDSDEAPVGVAAPAADEEKAEEAAPGAEYARGADPVKLYLKKMGSVSLLTREGEVEIAKRIEEGEVEILRALLASKLGTLAIVDLGERLETQR